VLYIFKCILFNTSIYWGRIFLPIFICYFVIHLSHNRQIRREHTQL